MNSELKKIVEGVKKAQNQVKALINSKSWDKSWVDEVRKYAVKQGEEAKKMLAADAGKVMAFVEREVRELEKIQKQVPGELRKLRKDWERLLGGLKKASVKKGASKGARKAPKARVKVAAQGGTKTSAAKKTAASRKKAAAAPQE
jgi:hypothetical protein